VLADWANAQAPALVLISPVLGALFAFVQTRFAAAERTEYGGAKHAPMPGAAQTFEKWFPARQPVVPVEAEPPRKRSVKVDTKALDPVVEDLGLGTAPAMRQDDATKTAPPANSRDDRIVLIGLLLVTTIVGGLIGCVIYLDSVYMR
jgi:hypothetical protein